MSDAVEGSPGDLISRARSMISLKGGRMNAENLNRAMQMISGSRSDGTDFEALIDQVDNPTSQLPRTANPRAPVQSNPQAAPAARAAGPAAAPVAAAAQAPVKPTDGTVTTTTPPETVSTTAAPALAVGGKPLNLTGEVDEETGGLPGAGMKPSGVKDQIDPLGYAVRDDDGGTAKTYGGAYNPTAEQRVEGQRESKAAQLDAPPDDPALVEQLERTGSGRANPSISPLDLLAGGASGGARMLQRGGSALVGEIRRRMAGPGEQYGPPVPVDKPRVSTRADSRPSAANDRGAGSANAPTAGPSPPVSVPTPAPTIVPPRNLVPDRGAVTPVGPRQPNADPFARPSNPPPVSVQIPTGTTPGPVQAMPQPNINMTPGRPVAPALDTPNAAATSGALRDILIGKGPPRAGPSPVAGTANAPPSLAIPQRPPTPPEPMSTQPPPVPVPNRAPATLPESAPNPAPLLNPGSQRVTTPVVPRPQTQGPPRPSEEQMVQDLIAEIQAGRTAPPAAPAGPPVPVAAAAPKPVATPKPKSEPSGPVRGRRSRAKPKGGE